MGNFNIGPKRKRNLSHQEMTIIGPKNSNFVYRVPRQNPYIPQVYDLIAIKNEQILTFEIIRREDPTCFGGVIFCKHQNYS